jgi:hypothetical protein
MCDAMILFHTFVIAAEIRGQIWFAYDGDLEQYIIRHELWVSNIASGPPIVSTSW